MKLMLLLFGLSFVLVTNAGRILESNMKLNENTDIEQNEKDSPSDHRRHKRQYARWSFDRDYSPSSYDRNQDEQISILGQTLTSLHEEILLNERQLSSTYDNIGYIFGRPPGGLSQANYDRRPWNYYPSTYDRKQDDAIAELDKRITLIQEELLFRKQKPQNSSSSKLEQRIAELEAKVTQLQHLADLDNGTRFGDDTDIEQERIWGTVDDNDGNRPILLKPVKPSRTIPKRPVEHGTVQAEVTTKAPIASRGVCPAAMLICCNRPESERTECFTKYGCVETSRSVFVCHPKVLQQVIDAYVAEYSNKGKF